MVHSNVGIHDAVCIQHCVTVEATSTDGITQGVCAQLEYRVKTKGEEGRKGSQQDGPRSRHKRSRKKVSRAVLHTFRGWDFCLKVVLWHRQNLGISVISMMSFALLEFLTCVPSSAV